VTIVVLYSGAAFAETPCDFKGLSVGDKVTPQQIMNHFGILKYKDTDEPQTQAQRDAAFNALDENAQVVGIMNALEEENWKVGPACNRSTCRIPFGVSVGNEPDPIQVDVFVAFEKHGKITAIEVRYDRFSWDEVLQILNVKYGDNWRAEEADDVTTDFQTKKSQPDHVTVLTHKALGTNTKSGDKCSLTVSSRDIVFVHSMPPPYRAVMEIKLISKNF
jgi:hypothetical protein